MKAGTNEDARQRRPADIAVNFATLIGELEDRTRLTYALSSGELGHPPQAPRPKVKYQASNKAPTISGFMILVPRAAAKGRPSYLGRLNIATNALEMRSQTQLTLVPAGFQSDGADWPAGACDEEG